MLTQIPLRMSSWINTLTEAGWFFYFFFLFVLSSHSSHYHFQINAHIKFTLITYQTWFLYVFIFYVLAKKKKNVRASNADPTSHRYRKLKPVNSIQIADEYYAKANNKKSEKHFFFLFFEKASPMKKKKKVKCILNGKYFSNVNWIVTENVNMDCGVVTPPALLILTYVCHF